MEATETEFKLDKTELPNLVICEKHGDVRSTDRGKNYSIKCLVCIIEPSSEKRVIDVDK